MGFGPAGFRSSTSLIVANFAVWLFYELPNGDEAINRASFYPCDVDNACHVGVGAPRLPSLLFRWRIRGGNDTDRDDPVLRHRVRRTDSDPRCQRCDRRGTVKLVSCLVAAKIGGRDRRIFVVQGTPVPAGRSSPTVCGCITASR